MGKKVKKRILIGVLIVVQIGVLVFNWALWSSIFEEVFGKRVEAKETVVTLYSDSQDVVKTDEIDFVGKPTVDELAGLLSDWSGLDYELNDVEVKGDEVYVDWDEEASLLLDLDEIELKKGFYFEDMESLQKFMLDSLMQTIKLNLGYDTVYFTMNDGEPLTLVFEIIEEDEPYLGSEFYEAHSDNVGNLESSSYYSYYDTEYQLILTYPTAYSNQGTIDEAGKVTFDSVEEGGELAYFVTTNIYHDTQASFIETSGAEQIEGLEGNRVISIAYDVDFETGETKPYAYCWLIEEDYIAVAYVECYSMTEAEVWYEEMLGGEISIDVIENMEADLKGDEIMVFEHYYYLDESNQLLLSYPSYFSTESSVDDAGNVLFYAEGLNNGVLTYFVTTNTYSDTPDSFIASSVAEEIEGLEGNMVISLSEEFIYESGETKPFVTCWRIEPDYIAVAHIECESMEEASSWYEAALAGALSIDDVTAMDSNQWGALEKTYYSYLDEDYQLLLTYPTIFASEGVVDDIGSVIFDSMQGNNKLLFNVGDNTYNMSPDSLINAGFPEAIEVLDGNIAVTIHYETDYNTGEEIPHACIWKFNEAYIGTASIECESMEEATSWYEAILEGDITIDEVTGMSTENGNQTMEEMEYYSYYDSENDITLTFPTIFSSSGEYQEFANQLEFVVEYPMISEAYEGDGDYYESVSCIVFPSVDGTSSISYRTIENTHGYDQKEFGYQVLLCSGVYEAIGDNIIIYKEEKATGEIYNDYYVSYNEVFKDKISCVYIYCETEEKADYWLDLLKENVVDITQGDATSSGTSESSSDSAPSYADQYPIYNGDGENVSEKMDFEMIDGVLYVEARSYYDAFSVNDHEVYYSRYNTETGYLDIYSWATDVIIAYFVPGVNAMYGLEDVITDKYAPIVFENEILTYGENTIMVPFEAIKEKSGY